MSRCYALWNARPCLQECNGFESRQEIFSISFSSSFLFHFLIDFLALLAGKRAKGQYISLCLCLKGRIKYEWTLGTHIWLTRNRLKLLFLGTMQACRLTPTRREFHHLESHLCWNLQSIHSLGKNVDLERLDRRNSRNLRKSRTNCEFSPEKFFLQYDESQLHDFYHEGLVVINLFCSTGCH